MSSFSSAMSESSSDDGPSSFDSDSEDGAANLREAKRRLKTMGEMPAPELTKQQKRHLCGWGEDFVNWSGPVVGLNFGDLVQEQSL